MSLNLLAKAAMKLVARIAVGAVLLMVLVGVWNQMRKLGSTTETEVEILDPAKVELIRTPGGFLQVTEMRKVEEFAWQTGWDCPFVDCSKLPKTISKIRVKAHYIYRIPLAEQWRLEPEAQHYKLTVPALQLQVPIAFDTATIEIVTQSSILSPSAAPNREKVLRYLGPELAQRGASTAYINVQQLQATQTVNEFAQQWMLEQSKKIERPIRISFTGPNPA